MKLQKCLVLMLVYLYIHYKIVRAQGVSPKETLIFFKKQLTLLGLGIDFHLLKQYVVFTDLFKI